MRKKEKQRERIESGKKELQQGGKSKNVKEVKKRKEGNVIQKPTRCKNNSFIDLQDQLNMFRANFCPSSGAQD